MTEDERSESRQWKMGGAKVLFLFLLIAVSLLLLQLPLYTSVIAAPTAGALLVALWKLNVAPRQSKRLVSGDHACPACSSMQTDEVEGTNAQGEVVTFFECFACGHRWSDAIDVAGVAVSHEPAADRRRRRR